MRMDTTQLLKLIGLLIIQVIAVLGNLLMFVVGIKNKDLRNFQNAFIFNMALADLCQGLFIMTSATINIFYGQWVVPTPSCEIFGILKVVLTLASVYSLSGISILRYFYVVKHTKRMNSLKSAVLGIAATWCISIFLALTPLFGWGVLGFEDGKEVCTVLFHVTPSHTLVVFITGLFMNVAVMLFCYVCIFKTLRSSTKRAQRQPSRTYTTDRIRTLSEVTSIPSSPEETSSEIPVVIKNDNSKMVELVIKNNNSKMVELAKIEEEEEEEEEEVQEIDTVERTEVNDMKEGSPKPIQCLYDLNNTSEEGSTPNIGARKSSSTLREQLRKHSTILSYITDPMRRPTLQFSKIPTKEMSLLKTICTIIVVFICCWTPYVVFNMVRMFGGSPDNNVADTITMWLGFINSAVNPVIYGLLNKQFRDAMKEVLMIKKYSFSFNIESFHRRT